MAHIPPHLDYAGDREGEVEGLLGIGATRHPKECDPEGNFIVLEDLDGDSFCAVQAWLAFGITDPIPNTMGSRDGINSY